MPTWTVEQILALAPDSPSAKAGQGLAQAGKWLNRSRDQRGLWGECKGSGQQPYQTGVDLSGPFFKCSCPSRKFPCKHALGLSLLFAGQPAVFAEGSPPPWIEEWRVKRDRRSQTATVSAPADPAREAGKAAAKVKRASDRQSKVEAGLAELERWLRDLARRGLANAQAQAPRYWEAMAARMVDAQAPGIARWLREMAVLPASGDGWDERLLGRLGKLYLLLQGFRRLPDLPAPTQADIRATIGWTQTEEDLPASAWVRDRWRVVGQRGYEEDRLRVQRSWLFGENSHQAALVLAFAYQGQALDVSLIVGTVVEAELGFYPSNYPLRAMPRKRVVTSTAFSGFPAHPTMADFFLAYADALAHQPWLEVFPAAIEAVVPARQGEEGFVHDAAGQRLPLHPRFPGFWRLLALSGDRPLTLFGEWDGVYLWPLAVTGQENHVSL